MEMVRCVRLNIATQEYEADPDVPGTEVHVLYDTGGFSAALAPRSTGSHRVDDPERKSSSYSRALRASRSRMDRPSWASATSTRHPPAPRRRGT
jgi:hypothetical protein